MALPHQQDIDQHPFYVQLIGKLLNWSSYLSSSLGGRLAYATLAAPRRKALKPAEEAFLEKAKKNYCKVSEMDIATYHWPGNGPRILLAHGWDSHSGRWQPLAEYLQTSGADLYALDGPAHGATRSKSFNVVYYAEAIAAVSDNVRPDIIIGHSAGGMSAIYYLTEMKPIVNLQKLVLLATPAHLLDFLRSFQQTLQLRARVMELVEEQFIARFQHGFAYFDLAHFAQKLTLPGLIIHDALDDVAPVEGAKRISANWPSSELVLTQGLGHSLQTKEVWERVANFCKF